MQHSFDVDIAKEYGILEAILLNNIWYWIEKKKANEVNFYDGFYWTYNSTRAFNQLFPYVSQRQIQNALKKLKEQELIQTGNYNKIAYDRTLWYAFTKKGECIMQKCKMDYADLLNGIDKNAQPIPNNKPVNKPNSKQNKKEKEYLSPLGEFKNVLLTEEEFDKLKTIPNYEEKIEDLSIYLENNPKKKYASHYATILTWYRREQKNKPNASNTHKREEIVPEWINKSIETKTDLNKQKEIEDMLKGLDEKEDFETRKAALEERLRNKYKKK